MERQGAPTRWVCDIVLGYFCLHGSEYLRKIHDAYTIRRRSTELTDCKKAVCEGVHKPIDGCGHSRWSERRGLCGSEWTRLGRSGGKSRDLQLQEY